MTHANKLLDALQAGNIDDVLVESGTEGFTKGPWVIREQKSGYTLSSPECLLIRPMYSGMDGEGPDVKETVDRWKADGRLFAQAKTNAARVTALLAVLEEVEHALSNEALTSPVDYRQRALDTIKKARETMKA